MEIKIHVVYLAILHTEAQTDFHVLSIQGKSGWKGEKRKRSALHSLTLTHSSSLEDLQRLKQLAFQFCLTIWKMNTLQDFKQCSRIGMSDVLLKF